MEYACSAARAAAADATGVNAVSTTMVAALSAVNTTLSVAAAFVIFTLATVARFAPVKPAVIVLTPEWVAPKVMLAIATLAALPATTTDSTPVLPVASVTLLVLVVKEAIVTTSAPLPRVTV